MRISGLQKTTLLDFPGHVAAIVFLGGCNFRCPFCHNSDLISQDSTVSYSEDEALDFFKKRASILEGICITGGEPTLQDGLEDFIKKIRELGLLIKLDTNGYRPNVLRRLYDKGLLDYVAMDIKAGRTNYARAAGIKQPSLSLIDESIEILLQGIIPYEFRTTVVNGLHSDKDFREIGDWVQGCEQFYLQNFRESDQVLSTGFSPCSKEELLFFSELLSPFVKKVSLRGIDY